MEILVCIKQVPGTSAVEVDPVTGVLRRDGVESKLNPYDLYALELAFQLRQKYGGRVRTITMGPPQAKAAVLEALYMGADGGAVISDRRFAGADVLATSYTLAQGLRSLAPFDLILCGKQTTDGDTAQVGPEIAEHLDLPHATGAAQVLAAGEGDITVRGAQDGRVHHVHLHEKAAQRHEAADQPRDTRQPPRPRHRSWSLPELSAAGPAIPPTGTSCP